MTHRDAATLSAGTVAKAKREGRFYAGRVYGTKKQCEDARREGRSRGKKTTASRAPPAAVGGGSSRESVVVEIDQSVSWNLTRFSAIALNGASVASAIAAYQDRNYRVLGVRLQVMFPFKATALGRWACATTHKLSSGDKTVPQVATVKGAKLFDDVRQIDAWVTMTDVQCSNPLTEDGSKSAVLDSDLRHCVWALECNEMGSDTITVKWHVTLQVDRQAAANVDL